MTKKVKTRALLPKGKRIIPEVGLLEDMIPYLLYPEQIPWKGTQEILFVRKRKKKSYRL